jgi:hypothetical protein
MVLATHSITILCVGAQVTCDSFVNLRLCFSRFTRLDIFIFRSKNVILHVGSICAEAAESKIIDSLTAFFLLDNLDSKTKTNSLHGP